MGYKPFGKNRVIVLPVPDSDMTAEEYRNAYGIELDSIEMRDLILLQEEGKQAYPVLYIDKENKVLYTADKAFSYASGFELVEGDSLINQVISQGTIENAKPIYWHSVYFERSATSRHFFNGILIILNNSSAPINKTDFLNIIASDGFYGIVFSGFHEQTNSATEPTSSSLKLVAIKGTGTGVLFVQLTSENVEETLAETVIVEADWNVEDRGTNKIN